jgi:hypothetical protein
MDETVRKEPGQTTGKLREYEEMLKKLLDKTGLLVS